jgi:hypothetical protein
MRKSIGLHTGLTGAKIACTIIAYVIHLGWLNRISFTQTFVTWYIYVRYVIVMYVARHAQKTIWVMLRRHSTSVRIWFNVWVLLMFRDAFAVMYSACGLLLWRDVCNVRHYSFPDHPRGFDEYAKNWRICPTVLVRHSSATFSDVLRLIFFGMANTEQWWWMATKVIYTLNCDLVYRFVRISLSRRQTGSEKTFRIPCIRLTVPMTARQ